MVSDLKNKKAISPIITTILLVVVGVILITVVLNFGKNFTTKSLDQTTNFGSLKVSDAKISFIQNMQKTGYYK